MYVAIEFNVTDEEIKETGRKEFYDKVTLADAVGACLCTHRLHNANAHVGSMSNIVNCFERGINGVGLSYLVRAVQPRETAEMIAWFKARNAQGGPNDSGSKAI